VFKSGWIDKWNSLKHHDRLLYYHLFGLILELDENALDFEYISSKLLLQQLFINRGEYNGDYFYLEVDLEQQNFKSFCILVFDRYNYANSFGLQTAYTSERPTYSENEYLVLLYGHKYIDTFKDDIMKKENFEHLIIGVNIVEDIQNNNLLEATKNYWVNNSFDTTINDNWAIKIYDNDEYKLQEGGFKYTVVYRKKSKSSKKKRKSSKRKRKSSKRKTKRKSHYRK
jgi:hypothetical protein